MTTSGKQSYVKPISEALLVAVLSNTHDIPPTTEALLVVVLSNTHDIQPTIEAALLVKAIICHANIHWCLA